MVIVVSVAPRIQINAKMHRDHSSCILDRYVIGLFAISKSKQHAEIIYSRNIFGVTIISTWGSLQLRCVGTFTILFTIGIVPGE